MTNRARSLTDRTVSGMMWIAWGSGATAVFKVVVLVLLTRLLSPADFGLVGAALVVSAFSLTFSQLGLGPAVVQRSLLEPRHISTAFYASTGLGFLVAALVWLSAPIIAGFFRMDQLVPVVRALALAFPVVGISTVAEGLIQRDLRFRLLANVGAVSYGVGYGLVGIALALLGWGVWSLVAAHLAQILLRATILLRAAPPLLRPRPTWECFRQLMGFGAGMSIARIAVIVANQADNLVVGRWLGAVALGLYSRSYQLMAVPTALLGEVLDKVLFPTLARVQDDRQRLTLAYLQGVAMVALVTLPAGVVAAILGPELVMVVFGGRWAAMIPPFQVLALGMMFRSGYIISDSVTRATGKVYHRAWRQALYAGLVLLGAWVGQHKGVTGVALGVLGALCINYLVMAQLGLSVVQASWRSFLQAQLPALRLTIVLGVVTLGMSSWARHLGLPPLAGLAAGVVAAAGAALLAVWLAPRLALGEHGMRMGALLRAFVEARAGHPGLRGST